MSTKVNVFLETVSGRPVGELVPATDEHRATIPSGCIMDAMGMELTHVGRGTARATMLIQEHHLNQVGVAQAGALAALADAVAGWAAKGALPDHDATFVTADLRMNLLRPCVEGTDVIATAQPTHLGRRFMLIDVALRSQAEDKLIATFTASEFVLSPGA